MITLLMLLHANSLHRMTTTIWFKDVNKGKGSEADDDNESLR